MLTRNWNC